MLLANPRGLASAASLVLGTSLLPAPRGCVQINSQLVFLIWEFFTVPLSSLEKNNLWLAIIGAPGEQQSCLLKGGKPR